MKYLAWSDTLQAMLPDFVDKYTVLSFFFDFRQGENVENTVEGLLRSLYLQCNLQSLRGTAAATWILQAGLEEEIQSVGKTTLIFVDGLDEFEGSLFKIADLSVSLSHVTNVKICVASRKEPAFREVFRDMPCLHMSDHNSQGIQNYISFTIRHFGTDQVFSEYLDLTTLQKLLHERAEGVFLWVFLALQELREACAHGSTEEEVEEMLRSLPSELTPFYQRIVNKLPNSRKSEAAIMYTILENADLYTVTLDILFAAVQFLVHEVGVATLPAGLVSGEQFMRRFNATMGGLFELCAPSNSPGDDRSPVPKVIHETVRAYSRETRWARDWLPIQFQQTFPDFIWARLCCMALKYADERLVGRDSTQSESWFEDVTISGYHDYRLTGYMNAQDFANALRKPFVGDSILSWSRLLHHSMDAIYAHLEEIARRGGTHLQPFAHCAMQSSWTRLRLSRWKWDTETIVLESGNLDNFKAPDMIQAAAYGAYHYLDQINEHVAKLTDTEREILVMTILLRWKLQSPMWWKVGLMSRTLRRDKDRKVVDRILIHNTQLTSSMVGVYLELEYQTVPSYLGKHMDKQASRQWPPASIPACYKNINGWPSESPLFWWAWHRWDDERDETLFFRDTLHVLRKLGVAMHSLSSSGKDVVHYIVGDFVMNCLQLEGRRFLGSAKHVLREAITKLYVLEDAGAKFGLKLGDRTVLEIFEQGCGSIDVVDEELLAQKLEFNQHFPNHQVEQLDEDVLATWEDKDAFLLEHANANALRLSQMRFMLKHKEATGHLPRPKVVVNPQYVDKEAFAIAKTSIEKQYCERCTYQAATGGNESSAPGEMVDVDNTISCSS